MTKELKEVRDYLDERIEKMDKEEMRFERIGRYIALTQVRDYINKKIGEE